LCAIAEKLSATARRVTVEDREALRSFDEMGCQEVAHIVGIFNYLTRLADRFGLELHPALMEAARSGMPLRRAGGLARRTRAPAPCTHSTAALRLAWQGQ
jgi:hypothetical protein